MEGAESLFNCETSLVSISSLSSVETTFKKPSDEKLEKEITFGDLETDTNNCHRYPSTCEETDNDRQKSEKIQWVRKEYFHVYNEAKVQLSSLMTNISTYYSECETSDFDKEFNEGRNHRLVNRSERNHLHTNVCHGSSSKTKKQNKSVSGKTKKDINTLGKDHSISSSAIYDSNSESILSSYPANNSSASGKVVRRAFSRPLKRYKKKIPKKGSVYSRISNEDKDDKASVDSINNKVDSITNMTRALLSMRGNQRDVKLIKVQMPWVDGSKEDNIRSGFDGDVESEPDNSASMVITSKREKYFGSKCNVKKKKKIPSNIINSCSGTAKTSNQGSNLPSSSTNGKSTALKGESGGTNSNDRGSNGSKGNNNQSNNGEKGKGGNNDEDESEEEEEDDESLDDSEDEDDDLLSADGEEVSWIQWFTGFRGNEFFCQVDEDYIQDDFNLTGLSSLVPLYDYALDMIQDVELHLEKFSEEQQEVIENAAEVLYGLIHARYILTSRGMVAMYEKYQRNDFGRCPRVYCEGERVLPVGLSDVPRTNSLHIFCPKCRDVYSPTSSRHAALDGAYFGTSFCHLFLMAYPDLIPRQPLEINPNTLELSRMMQEQKEDENNMDVENKGDIPLLSSSRPAVKQKKRRGNYYIPRVYGFAINSRSDYYQYRLKQGAQQKKTPGQSSTSSTTV